MRLTKWSRRLLSVGGLLLLTGSDGLRTDELKCEEAAKHLIDCCPGFVASKIQCGDACNASVLDIPTSECMLGLGCEAIRARGFCDASYAPSADDGGVAGVPACG